MSTPCFYHPSLSTDEQNVQLSASEAAHAIQSRRLKCGDSVVLINGQGLVAYGRLGHIDRRSAEVTLEQFNTVKHKTPRLTIAVAIPKGDRQKVMVDMLTQHGVFRIIPLECEYSVSKLKPNQWDKWQRIAIEAAKQSQNPFLPEISHPMSLHEVLKDVSGPGYLASVDGQTPREILNEQINQDVLVFVGPEGGFSDSELAMFKAADVQAVTLATHILRTETAAIAAASVFHF